MPTIDMTATGKNITRMMKAAGMTVKDLQEIFGFATPQAIYKWKNGTAMPTIDNLVMPVEGKKNSIKGCNRTPDI